MVYLSDLIPAGRAVALRDATVVLAANTDAELCSGEVTLLIDTRLIQVARA